MRKEDREVYLRVAKNHLRNLCTTNTPNNIKRLHDGLYELTRQGEEVVVDISVINRCIRIIESVMTMHECGGLK